ncbi:MAG: organic solvent tolerance protein OstA [Candidatus Saganbacteria bacterium]|uniref:Organic solvent tolerance protein OstA n=1 Tax=Candidatus Saganbacteria bacterium TaxID=2575572 RepID=A0A833NS13_UNCSA|nr:MAG: organic solvent tolerance protein OstA [Candidatus Saganbacteria bacterium]
MENAPWRIIFLGAAASLILLFITYFLILPKTANFDQQKIEKILEFKNSYVSGRDNGKKVWEFYAKEGWSGKSGDVTYLKDVSKGRFYKNGDLIVKDLEAPLVKAWKKNKLIEAFGESNSTNESRLKAVIAFTPRGRRKFANLISDQITYNPDAKTSTVSGRISLKDNASSLFSNNMSIDHEKEISSLSNGVKYKRPDISINCDTIDYFAKEEKMICRASIETTVKSKPNATSLKCDYMEVFIESNKDVIALGSIEATQGKKIIFGNSLTYNKKFKYIIIKENVKAIIEKAKVILKERTINRLKSEEAKKILHEKTVLTSNLLELSTENGNAKAIGNVFVLQKGKVAKADSAIYSEKDETITLTRGVFLKKEKQWIKCQKIIVSVKNETFDAAGSVEAEFKIKK